MNRSIVIVLIIATLVTMMLFFNKKVNLFRLFARQIQVFKNDHTNKFSIWDLLCFTIFPIITSILIVYGLSYQIDIKLAEILTTVFSIIFTILFGFAAVIVEKSKTDNSKKERVIVETFISIATSTTLSLIAIIISILLTKFRTELAASILSVFLFTLSFIIIMLLLMVTKRTFVIYCEGE